MAEGWQGPRVRQGVTRGRHVMIIVGDANCDVGGSPAHICTFALDHSANNLFNGVNGCWDIKALAKISLDVMPLWRVEDSTLLGLQKHNPAYGALPSRVPQGPPFTYYSM